jgi:hypothetical protein
MWQKHLKNITSLKSLRTSNIFSPGLQTVHSPVVLINDAVNCQQYMLSIANSICCQLPTVCAINCQQYDINCQQYMLSIANSICHHWQMNEIWVWRNGGRIPSQEDWSTWTDTRPTATLYKTNLTWNSLWLNPVVNGEKSVTSHLTYGTTHQQYQVTLKNTMIMKHANDKRSNLSKECVTH